MKPATQTDSATSRILATCIAVVALVLGGGAIAGLLGLELPEPANSMVHSLLWVLLPIGGTLALRRGWASSRLRLWWMAAVVVVIDVLMGTQPNAMGAFTHGIFGLLSDGLVFNDYLIGMGVVTVVMLIASKAVCSWACHLGTLQELLYRLARRDGDGGLRELKLPFALSMASRAVIFAIFAVVALGWGVDISLPWDPHRLFRLSTMFMLPALVTLTLTLALSPFVYRPWCQLACPLGLLGWVMERAALLRVRVDPASCTSSRSCVRACPCSAMEGILDGESVRPDCWSCGSCIERCPAGAIQFRSPLGS